ncbi:TIR domain-containing protein [Magnetococcales bacterium HHB-1]
MKAWSSNTLKPEKSLDLIYDKSLDRRVDSNNPEYVMRRIREDYLTGSSCTIVLCGTETYKRKYVDWEIKATLDKNHGVLAVLLPSLLNQRNWIVPSRLMDNIESEYAIAVEWQRLIDNPQILSDFIETAIGTPLRLIINTAQLKRRNG